MSRPISVIAKYPRVIWSFLFGVVIFGVLSILFTTYPIILEYIHRSIDAFQYGDTWKMLVVYVYNTTSGGIVNMLNTFLFGVWFMLLHSYRLVVIESGLPVTIMRAPKSHKGAGVFGGLVALAGGGCISCGATFLVNLFGGVAGGLLASLPFGGAELAFIGTVFLVISIARVASQIRNYTPGVCPVV